VLIWSVRIAALLGYLLLIYVRTAAHCVLQVGSRMKSLSFAVSSSHGNLGFGVLAVVT